MRIGALVEAESSAAATERLAALESEGFEAIWIDEAATASGGGLLAAAAVADATTRARVGVFGPLPASLHPLRLAEDLAMLDIVSGGRLDWIPTAGASAGHDGDLDEVLEIVLRAWTGERFAHRGARFAFPELACFPLPEQRPHPKLWLAAQTGPPRTAAEPALGTWCEAPVSEVAPAADPTPRRPVALVTSVAPAAVLEGLLERVAPSWLIVRLAPGDLSPEAAPVRRRLVAAAAEG